MPNTSRRNVLAVFAGAAASVPLGTLTATASPRSAAVAAPTLAPAASTLPAGTGTLTSPRSAVWVAGLDPNFYRQVALGTFTTKVLPGTPERLEVTAGSQHVAVLTKGARTVVLKGAERTFIENKKSFADTFQRTLPDTSRAPENREYWGMSPCGGKWSTEDPHSTDFAVVPGSGTIKLSSTNASRHATLVDSQITDVDVSMTAKFDKVPAGQACSFALSFGYDGIDDSYRARLSFLTTGAVELRVEKEVNNQVTPLTVNGDPIPVATGIPENTNFTIRVLREGSRIRVKAWRTGTTELGWALDTTHTDSKLLKGRVGVRALANTGCTNAPTLIVSSFKVDASTWEQPATVTHDSWVRVLPAPFDGTWTQALEQTIRGWAGSPSPDVLAHAAMFLAEVPAVTSATAQATGAQVMGEAGYGKMDLRGLRPVGADFHDYMERKWTFPDKSMGIEAGQARNLDCSGYVRMVYGYHMGVPMYHGVHATKEAIPRTSGEMADHAPGVRVATKPADLTTLAADAPIQPGDLVLFDASPVDPAEPNDHPVDHVGIYLGLDIEGKRRFLSSRKTGNGPTMADLGGTSLLDGTGNYATSLRTVHRI